MADSGSHLGQSYLDGARAQLRSLASDLREDAAQNLHLIRGDERTRELLVALADRVEDALATLGRVDDREIMETTKDRAGGAANAPAPATGGKS